MKYAIVEWIDGKPHPVMNWGVLQTFDTLEEADAEADRIDGSVFRRQGIENCTTVISLEGVKE